MKTIRVNVYKFHELSKEIQDKLVKENMERIYSGAMESINEDIDESIKKFMYYTSVSTSRCNLVVLDNQEDHKLEGKYLYRRVRQLIDAYFSEPKRYYKNGKCRYSNIIIDQSCVLTGCYTDNVILSPLFAYIEGKLNVNSYHELIKACFKSVDNFIHENEEYFSSNDYIKEILENQDYDYTIDGTIVNY